MLPSLVCLAFVQASQFARVVVDPGKDSGALRKFTVEVPQSWFKNGKWPLLNGGEDGMTYTCGGRDTLSLSLSQAPENTQASVLSMFDRTRKNHPNEFFAIKKGSLAGAMVVLPQKNTKARSKIAKDLLFGRLYDGNHRALFFEYSLYSHPATPADRALLTRIVTSVQP